jgi:tyrosinase
MATTPQEFPSHLIKETFMSQHQNGLTGVSRRDFLATAGTALAVSAWPWSSAIAQTVPPYVRMSLDDPAAAPMIEAYGKAVTAMLKLPPTDLRNWYRNTLIHTLDCPHGNWWFLPWHRGYLGWFEQTCRSLSGVKDFALPYWDWTAENTAGTLGIPASFQGADNPLDPSSSLYVNGFDAFEQQFKGPTKTWWDALTADQRTELTNRGYDSFDAFWTTSDSSVTSTFNGSYPPARDPNFGPPLPSDVQIQTIMAALKQTQFTSPPAGPADPPSSLVGFGSDQAQQHSDGVGFGILESMPHNNVHGAVSGFMGAFLSPIDPIFFMHHANLDRLWDVWTRKQQKLGLPTLPAQGVADWNKEPFLFYIGSNGQPIATRNDAELPAHAGYYATIGMFNYTYTAGSGSDVVPSTSPTTFAGKLLATKLSSTTLKVGQMTIADGVLPEALYQEVAANSGTELVARITLTPPATAAGTRFLVLVNPPKGVRNVSYRDPSYAGTITPFGSHRHARPASYSIVLTDAVRRLQKAKRLKPGDPLQIHVVIAQRGVSLVPVEVPLSSVSIGAF